jgi:hypothetical protein
MWQNLGEVTEEGGHFLNNVIVCKPVTIFTHVMSSSNLVKLV